MANQPHIGAWQDTPHIGAWQGKIAGTPPVVGTNIYNHFIQMGVYSMNQGFLKQSTAGQSVMIGPFVDDTDFKTVETGLTIANTDIKLSKNGAAGVNKNSGGGTHRNNGMYSITLDATDTNTIGELEGSVVVSGALPVIFKFSIIEENIYVSLFQENAAAFDSNQRTNVGQWLSQAVTLSAGNKPDVNIDELKDDAQSATDLKDFADAGYDPATNKVQGVVLVDTTTTNTDMVDISGLATTTELDKVPKSDGVVTWNSTALASIESEANDALVGQKLDHLIAVADADDVVDDSIIAKMASKNATADWSSFDNETDSLEAIRDNIVAASPQAHSAESSVDTTGTIDSGTYADTITANLVYWQISPAGAAVGGFGLNVTLVFTLGTGLDRSPEAVNITGYFDSSPLRAVDVWAYNYMSAAFEQVSNSSNNMQNAASNQNYQYSLTSNHIQTSDGELQIRFTSASTTITDDLFIDFVSVSSVAVEAAGLTADAIQQAVWARTDTGHDEDTLGYNLSKAHLVHGDIVSATDATQFVIDAGVAVNDMYNGMIITVEDKTDDHYEIRRIVDSIASTNEVIVDRAFSFTPVANDDFYIMNGAYADVNMTHVSGTLQTANDIGADTDAILVDTNELQTNQGNWLTATTVDLNDDAITSAKFDETTAFPVKSADSGVTEIARTGADGDTLETISDQIDAVPTVGEIRTEMESAGSDLDLIMIDQVNKKVITEATGATEQFNDSDVSIGTIAAAYTSDGTYTTRKRMVQ